MKIINNSNLKRSNKLKQYWKNKKDHTSPFKGKSYIERYGKEKAALIKTKISIKMRGENNPSKKDEVKQAISITARNHYKYGVRKLSNNNTANGYYREDLQCYMRSNWEANFARILNFYNIEFQYEKPISIILNNNDSIYFVDFYLPYYDMYIEIKGTPYSKEKYLAFVDQYNYKNILIDKSLYKEIIKLFSYSIKNWEGRKQYNTEIIPSETIRQTKFLQLLNI